MLSHASPEKHQSLSSSFGWLSPMGQMECLSPGESRLSFDMSSPPYHGAGEVETPISFVKLCDTLNSTISPSIFSPQEKRGMKLLKKRDYYQRDLMPGDTFLLLNEKNSAENSSSSEPAPACSKSEPVVVAPEPVLTKSHSLRNHKKYASTPVAVSHPVITPEVVSHYKDSSAANTRKSSKHNIISPDIPLDSASKSLIMSSPAAAVSCNCKKSKCLKLYCDCFATLSYCNANSCNCADCANNSENEILRQEAIKVTKDRNAFAFRTKISQKQEHAAGCRCKNSHCLKKYCECFTGNAFCGNNCKCLTCLNYSGSTALDQVRHTSSSRGSDALITRERSPLKSPVGKGGSSIFFHSGGDDQLLSCLTTLKSPNHFMGLLSDSHSGGLNSDDSALMLDEQGSPLATSLVLSGSSNGSSSSGNGHKSKKNRVKFASVPVSYPFFGEHLPSTTKIISLKVLDYLNSKDIYSMAQVNSMWSIVAFDDALWE